MFTFRQWLSEAAPFQKLFKDKLAEKPPNEVTSKVKRRRRNNNPSPEAQASNDKMYEKGRQAFGKLFEPVKSEPPKKLAAAPTAPTFNPQKKKKWWQIFEEKQRK